MNKSTLKTGAVVVVSVMVAGFLMNQLRGNALVDQARGGYNN